MGAISITTPVPAWTQIPVGASSAAAASDGAVTGAFSRMPPGTGVGAASSESSGTGGSSVACISGAGEILLFPWMVRHFVSESSFVSKK